MKGNGAQQRLLSAFWVGAWLLAAGAVLTPAAVVAEAVDPNYGWIRRMGGTGFDSGYGVAVDKSGNIYTTGYFEGAMDFAADFGGIDIKTSAGSLDIFITRINANGSYGWTRRMGGASVDRGYSVALDADGNIYVTGLFVDTVDFAADFGGSDVKTSAGAEDIFITRINPDGAYGWTRRMGGTGSDYGQGVSVDRSGNVYATGNFSNTVDFAADFGGSEVKNSPGGPNIFIAHLDANGGYVWTKRIGGSSFGSLGYGLAVDLCGNVYVTGEFSGAVNFAADFGGNDVKNPASIGDSEIFITRVNAAGTYGWTRRMGGLLYDLGYQVAVDASGNVYLTGEFKDTVDFAADFGGSDSKTSAGAIDIFITRISADGDYGWTRRIGEGNDDESYAISVDPKGNAYITGFFEGAVDFASDFGGIDPKTAAGENDIFVTRINTNGTYGWTKRMGATGMAHGNGIGVDSRGNVFVIGGFNDTVNFAVDFGGSDIRSSAGNWDIFVTQIIDPLKDSSDDNKDGGGCALAPGGNGAGAGLWPVLPLALAWAVRTIRRRKARN